MDLTKVPVLVVDDNELIRNMVCRLLELSGCPAVETAVDGDQAWDRIDLAFHASRDFGLVISDYDMPHATGLELLCRMRCHGSAEIARMPFLLMTGNDDSILRDRAAGLEAAAVLSKPFTVDALLEAIAKIGSEEVNYGDR